MTQQPETVEIEIPARPEFVRIVRLVMAGMGNSAGLNMEEIEDLKLAVGEACHTVLQGGTPTCRIRVRAGVQHDMIRIEIARPAVGCPATLPADAEDKIGFVLMRHLMDEVTLESPDDGPTIRMMRRLPVAATRA